MKKKKIKNLKSETKNTLIKIKGLARKEHFESGGTLSSWRGVHKIQDSTPKKEKTRANIKNKRIKESLE